MKKLLLVALSTFALSAHALEPKLYAGASLSTWAISLQPFALEPHLQTLEATVGAVVCPYISFEGRAGAGFTTGRDSTVVTATQAEVTIDYYASGYFRPFLANEKASLYGLLGVTTLQLSGWDDSGTATDGSYGVGVTFTTSPKTQFVAEWKRLIGSDDFDVSGGTVGFTYQF